jgi:hypothetical protein
VRARRVRITGYDRLLYIAADEHPNPIPSIDGTSRVHTYYFTSINYQLSHSQNPLASGWSLQAITRTRVCGALCL